jgi:hypothetical protein
MKCDDSQSNGPYGMRRGPRVAWDQEGGHWCPSSHFPHILRRRLAELQGFCANVAAPQYEASFRMHEIVVQVSRSRIDFRFADGANVNSL